MINLEELEPTFRDKFVKLVRDYLNDGIKIEPVVGLIDLDSQSRNWRRSRTDSEIDHAIFELQQEKCSYLAGVLRKNNSSAGTKITEHLPGFSWHNYGEAVEILVKDANTYEVYQINDNIRKSFTKLLKKHELSLSTNPVNDNLVIVNSPFDTPTGVYSMKEIDQLMQKKWG